MTDNILFCQNITIKYDTQIAVQEVSFALKARDYLCIVGANGSGKSTLLKGILHLLPLSGGKVTLSGVKETQIGYLPQQTKTQKDFPANVSEVVLSGCLNKQKKLLPFYSKQDKKSAAENLARLGLEKLASKSYRELSGGEQQRVLLARALCAAEKVLLLDEPFAGLDPSASAAMYSLLQKLNSQMGMTIIMISHDLKSAVKYANKILHLQKTPLYFGQKEDYLQTVLGKTMLGVERNV